MEVVWRGANNSVSSSPLTCHNLVRTKTAKESLISKPSVPGKLLYLTAFSKTLQNRARQSIEQFCGGTSPRQKRPRTAICCWVAAGVAWRTDGRQSNKRVPQKPNATIDPLFNELFSEYPVQSQGANGAARWLFSAFRVNKMTTIKRQSLNNNRKYDLATNVAVVSRRIFHANVWRRRTITNPTDIAMNKSLRLPHSTYSALVAMNNINILVLEGVADGTVLPSKDLWWTIHTFWRNRLRTAVAHI